MRNPPSHRAQRQAHESASASPIARIGRPRRSDNGSTLNVIASTKVPSLSGVNQRGLYERCAFEVAEDAQDHVDMKDKPRSLLKPQSAGDDGYNPINSDRDAAKLSMQVKTGRPRSPTAFDVDSGTLGSPLAGERLNPSGHAPSPDRHYELLQMSQNHLADLPSSELETKSVNGNGAMEPVDQMETPHKTPPPSLGRIIYEEAETSEVLPIISDPIATDDTDGIREKAHTPDGPIGLFQWLHSHLAEMQYTFTKLDLENARLKKQNASLDRHKARLKREADRLARRVEDLERRKASLESEVSVLQGERGGWCFEQEGSFDSCSD
ncbi:hypothetical protein JMJ78_0000981 [Colletotrichum scovillei]|nr:hypothetical protein JMJ78_0000981 [Colletotrichum scovillei]